MTIDGFIAEMQGYYNYKYNETQKKYIRKWLSDRSERTLPYIVAETIRLFNPTSTKPIPGVHDLEDALHIVKRDRAHEIRQPALPEPGEDTCQEPTEDQVYSAIENLTRIGLDHIAHRLRERYLHGN